MSNWTGLPQWEETRRILGPKDDLTHIAWQLDGLVDEVRQMNPLRDELERPRASVWLIALPLWAILGAYLWHLWRLYPA